MKKHAAFAFLWLIFWNGTGVLAQEATVSLEQLIQELRRSNPEVQAAAARYQAALSRVSREGALPDPRISFGWMSAGTLLPGGGLGTDPNASIGISVAQEFPFPGKRQLRSEMARREADSLKKMYSSSLLSRISALKRAYYELLFIYRSMDLLQENRDLLYQLERSAEARYTVGKGMQQDLIRAKTEISILENRLLSLEQSKNRIQAEINMLLNRPVNDPPGKPLPVELPPLSVLENYRDHGAEKAPMLLAQEAMMERNRLGVDLAHREYYPDLEVMTGYFHQGEMEDMWEIRFQFTVPIFYRKKQQKKLEEATFQLAEAKSHYQTIRQMVQFQLRDAFLRAETAQKLMDLYSRQIIPQSRLAFESSLASYETGGVDFLTVVTNFTSILAYQMSYYEQETEYLKAFAVLEEILGLSAEEVKS